MSAVLRRTVSTCPDLTPELLGSTHVTVHVAVPSWTWTDSLKNLILLDSHCCLQVVVEVISRHILKKYFYIQLILFITKLLKLLIDTHHVFLFIEH